MKKTIFIVFAAIINVNILIAFDMKAGAAIILPVYLAGLFFLNIDKFKKFKGAGIEAEMEVVVSKAYAAIEEIRKLGLALSEPIICEVAISGRMMQYIHLKYKLEFVQQIQKALKDLGVDKEKIDGICKIFYNRIENDHVKKILHAIQTEQNVKKLPCIDDIFHGQTTAAMLKPDIDKYVKENGITFGKQSQQQYDALLHFIANCSLKNPDEWQS